MVNKLVAEWGASVIFLHLINFICLNAHALLQQQHVSYSSTYTPANYTVSCCLLHMNSCRLSDLLKGTSAVLVTRKSNISSSYSVYHYHLFTIQQVQWSDFYKC